MSDKVIIYERPDGGTTIVSPAKGWTPEECIKHGDVPADALSHEIVDRSVLPTDRTFRNAWKKKDGGIEVDMPKARVIHMAKILIERDKELVRLDGEFMLALEDGDTVKQDQIKADKQKLRDIPSTFNLETKNLPHTLKAAWPAGLPKPNGSA